MTLHRDLIVLGGGVALMGEEFRGSAERTIRPRIGMLPPDSVAVRLSLLADRAGALSGLALAAKDGIC